MAKYKTRFCEICRKNKDFVQMAEYNGWHIWTCAICSMKISDFIKGLIENGKMQKMRERGEFCKGQKEKCTCRKKRNINLCDRNTIIGSGSSDS